MNTAGRFSRGQGGADARDTEFSSTSATSSAAPVGLLSDGVAPNTCPQLGTPFTLPGNKQVAIGAPDARWGREEATLGSRFISVRSLMLWVLVWALPTAISYKSFLRNLNCKALLLL